MVLCSLLDTAVGVNMSFHHKFCAALVKDFAQFHVTLCTTCMTTGIVVQSTLQGILWGKYYTPFYFCSNFVKPFCPAIIIGRYVPQ